jgi:hypothetical protein
MVYVLQRYCAAYTLTFHMEDTMLYAIAYRDITLAVVRVVGCDGRLFATTDEARKSGYEVLYR